MERIDEKLLDLGFDKIKITGYHDTRNNEDVLVHEFENEIGDCFIIESKSKQFNVFKKLDKNERSLKHVSLTREELYDYLEYLKDIENEEDQIGALGVTNQEVDVLHRALLTYVGTLETFIYEDFNSKEFQVEKATAERLLTMLRKVEE